MAAVEAPPRDGYRTQVESADTDIAVDPGLVQAWARGWAKSRGAGPPAPHSGGWHIELGWPEQKRRYVFAAPTPQIADLARTIDEPWVFLKVCADVATVRDLLPAHWDVRRTGTMMRLDPIAPTTFRRLPDGYALGVEAADGLLRAEATAGGGALAAWGRVAMIGDLAVFDRIATDEAHRRLGLGSAVMGALTDAASAMGATHGALVATPDGRALYRTLGWRFYSPYVTASIPA